MLYTIFIAEKTPKNSVIGVGFFSSGTRFSFLRRFRPPISEEHYSTRTEICPTENMVLLENDTFLTELTKMFQKGKTSGSLSLTMKRYDGRTKPEPRKGNLPEPQEYKCLIRATLGNKKISTVINQKDVNKFQMAYANVLKGNMDGLKKKDKRSATKSKSKATQ